MLKSTIPIHKKQFTFFLILTIISINLFTIEIENSEKANYEITLATDSWAPFYSPDLYNNGVFTNIVTEAFKRRNYECNINFVPWKRALDNSIIGYYDGLLGVFHKEEREKYFVYSKPILETNIAFFCLADRKITYTNLPDLIDYEFGIIRDYHYSPEFDTASYLNKQEVTLFTQNIDKLLRGRIDIMVESKEVIDWYLKNELKQHEKDIVMIEPVFQKKKLYVAISKNIDFYDNIIKALNSGLEIIKNDGTYDEIIKQHSDKY